MPFFPFLRYEIFPLKYSIPFSIPFFFFFKKKKTQKKRERHEKIYFFSI